ncbi:MAG: glycosyltransferase family 2 protein [Chloroflexota bacterium]|nr:glycosyltransferase family 2 protein [Chloroflexota bacterium]
MIEQNPQVPMTMGKGSDTPLLSIVIPAYNEGAPDRLPQSLVEIVAFVEAQDFPIEVVVVNNNSKDNTLDIALAASRVHPYIRALTETTQGKGAAVKAGMLTARGEYLFICDADLSMPIGEVLKFLPPQLSDYDIAIASREAKGSQRINEPEMRHIMGRVFNFIVKVIAVRGLNDTQCGFKCFRRDVALALFPLQTIDGWAFDVELLFIAQQHGYKIIEVPITWIYKAQSKISPIRDSINMVVETLRIRMKGWRGEYGDPRVTQKDRQPAP